MTPLFLIGGADNGDALLPVLDQTSGCEFQSCQLCFVLNEFFSSTEKKAALASGEFSVSLQQVWMNAPFVFFFSPSSSLRVDHQQPTTANCNQWLQWIPFSSSLLCRCVFVCVRAFASEIAFCFSIFHPIAQISHASACLLPRAPSCNVAWRWCVSPVHARSDISRPWLAAKASQEGSRVNKAVRVQSLHFSFIHTLRM